ncbi:MAG: hypothetical protein JST59_00840 [Actinobacteria bacterium]|nr:hypothetical protein [Actinomycetota bacterium]
MADSRLERHLNSLLEKVISEVRGLLRTNQDLKELEPLLKDYQDALELVGIISNVIDLYFRKVRERLAAPQEEDYRNL